MQKHIGGQASVLKKIEITFSENSTASVSHETDYLIVFTIFGSCEPISCQMFSLHNELH